MYELVGEASSLDLSKDENLVYDPDDLKGDLQTPGTYQKYVNELHAQYPNLNITALNWYLYFTDPVIESYWANSEYGDTIGITTSSAQSVQQWPRRDTELNTVAGNARTNGKFAFYGDQTITSFNELNQFSNITEIPSKCFSNSSLSSINLNNIVSIKPAAFQKTNLSGVINLPKLNSFSTRVL